MRLLLTAAHSPCRPGRSDYRPRMALMQAFVRLTFHAGWRMVEAGFVAGPPGRSRGEASARERSIEHTATTPAMSRDEGPSGLGLAPRQWRPEGRLRRDSVPASGR